MLNQPRSEEGEHLNRHVGLAAVKIKHVWGYIDMTGQLVIDPRYDDAGPFSDKRALVQENGKYGYIDRSGNMIIEPQLFEQAHSFRDGLALVKINGKYGFIDTEGRFVIDPEYDDARSFSEGRALVGVMDFDMYR